MKLFCEIKRVFFKFCMQQFRDRVPKKLLYAVIGIVLLTAGCAVRSHPVERALLDATEVVTSVAFGSCLYQWESQPFWRVIAEQKPDLFIFAGDAIYADWDGVKNIEPTADSLQAAWQQLADNPDFTFFRSVIPVLGTWDNHDYGSATGGKEFYLKDRSKELLLDFLQEPLTSDRRKRTGVYTDYMLGAAEQRVQIILLDTRSFRERPAFDTRSETLKQKKGIIGRYLPDVQGTRTLLGADQWQWLESKLKEPAAVRLIVSGIQILPTEKGMDEWGNYPHERSRLLRLLAGHTNTQTILLTGNTHFGEISTLKLGGTVLHEITASGLTHVAVPTAAHNPYRVGAPVGVRNYGQVRIDWDAVTPVITLTLYDTEGAIQISQPLASSD